MKKMETNNIRYKLLALALAFLLAFGLACKERPPDIDPAVRNAADAFIGRVETLAQPVALTHAENIANVVLVYANLPAAARALDDVADARQNLSDIESALIARCRESVLSEYNATVGFINFVGGLTSLTSASGPWVEQALRAFDALDEEKDWDGVKAAKTLLGAQKVLFEALLDSADTSQRAAAFAAYVNFIQTPLQFNTETEVRIESAHAFYTRVFGELTESQRRAQGVEARWAELQSLTASFQSLKNIAENAKLVESFISFVNGIVLDMNAQADILEAWTMFNDQLSAIQRQQNEATRQKLVGLGADFATMNGQIAGVVSFLEDLERDIQTLTFSTLDFWNGIEKVFDDFDDFSPALQFFAAPLMSRMENVKDAFLLKPAENMKIMPRIVYTARTTTVFGAKGYALLSSANIFGDSVPNGIPATATVTASIDGGAAQPVAGVDGEFSVVAFEFSDRSIISGAVTAEVIFAIDGRVLLPVTVTALLPLMPANNVRVGNVGYHYTHMTPDFMPNPFIDNEILGSFDPPAGRGGNTERLNDVYIAEIYDSSVVNPYYAEPLAVYEFKGEAPRFGSNIALTQTSKVNIDRVRNALANAGKTGAFSVRVAVRLKSTDPDFADGFIAPTSLSENILTVNVTSDDAGLLKFPEVTGIIPNIGDTQNGAWSDTGGVFQVLRFRVDGQPITLHPDFDHARVFVYNALGHDLGYIELRAQGNAVTATFTSLSNDTTTENWPSHSDPRSIYADPHQYNPILTAMGAMGSQIRFKTQIIAKDDATVFRSSGLSDFSPVWTAGG
ncbi:MAG: hypothetical protein FWH03_04870 [Firmicutes bacterium]|nr:hypothetical protein [Bacillota bacterium]